MKLVEAKIRARSAWYVDQVRENKRNPSPHNIAYNAEVATCRRYLNNPELSQFNSWAQDYKKEMTKAL